MTATEILDRFKELGVSVRLDGDKVRVTPVSKVPDELMVEAKAHKAEIVQQLLPTFGDGQASPLDRPPETEQELWRLIDHQADPEEFDTWLAWAMTTFDPAESLTDGEK